MRSSIYVFGTDGLKGLLNTVKLNRLNAIIAMWNCNGSAAFITKSNVDLWAPLSILSMEIRF